MDKTGTMKEIEMVSAKHAIAIMDYLIAHPEAVFVGIVGGVATFTTLAGIDDPEPVSI